MCLAVRVIFNHDINSFVRQGRLRAQVPGRTPYRKLMMPAAGVTRSLYLKELYVRQDGRRQGQGTGKLLMDELAVVARAHSCSRLEWTTDVSNATAQRFYEALGVEKNGSKVLYRLELNS